MRLGLFLFVFLLLTACTSNPIEQVLLSEHSSIKAVMDSLPNHEVQILWTQIDTTDEGRLVFNEHAFQVNKKNYFYPASTVKLPMAILAAEYISQNEPLNLDVTYVSRRDSMLHTVADDIRQIFAISDNEAYNRLYEALGRDFVNSRLEDLNVDPVRIAHRLSTSQAAAAFRTPVKFFPTYEGAIVSLGNTSDTPIKKLNVKGLQKGIGFIKDGRLIETPFDFHQKNYFPLQSQHDIMKRLFFPTQFRESEQFQLHPEIRDRIITAMRTVPRKAGYAEKDHYDSYVKFFMYGDSKEQIPEHIEIYNKVGYAYGTLTETAFIKDTKNGIQFLLSATILVNENRVFNDDIYEYETVGVPFLAQLGREVYQLELHRK
jgi:beta-lactamase class A